MASHAAGARQSPLLSLAYPYFFKARKIEGKIRVKEYNLLYHPSQLPNPFRHFAWPYHGNIHAELVNVDICSVTRL